MFSETAYGRVEQWYMWSFSLDEHSGLKDYEPTGLWVLVEKTRLLHPISDDTGLVAGALDGVQAHVERTEVTTIAETAWTCCFEVTAPRQTEAHARLSRCRTVRR
jgi:hypothetical protein